MKSGSNGYEDWSTIIERNGRERGDKVYLESLDQARHITFGELARYCDRVANFLHRKGIGRSDRISLIGKNSLETMIIYYGVLKYGAVINPIFFEESKENLYRIIDLVKPRLILYDGDLRLDKGRFPGSESIGFSEGAATNRDPDDLFHLLNGYEPVPMRCIARKKDVTLIVYTSGTMTLPKGIHITREGLFYMVDEIADRTGMTEEDRVLEYRAYNWASAQLLTILSTMLKGATLFLARKFSRTRFPDWLKQHRITISSGVPAVINMLINEPVPLTGADVPWLKFITSSSAPLSVESHLKFEERYCIPIQQMMGMSEAGWMLGNPPERRKLGSVGLPLKHKEIYFLNEKGDPCAPGEVGEMVVSGKAMGLCYSREDGSTQPFPREGFPTGDLGYADEDGYVFITGRKKDLIIRGGINISPMEINARLLEHPAVREAVTIGVPDAIYGEEVVCFVVPRQDVMVGGEEIVVHCGQTLPAFKVPKQVFVVQEIRKTQRGKVSKAELMRLYEEQCRLTDAKGSCLDK